MPRFSFHLQIEMPALDRLVAFFEGAQQAQIDAMSEQVRAASVRLQRKRAVLEQLLKENQ